ncbi:hypothetical protein U8Q06_34740 (plasmid) [Rhizobium beringeri]|uniref:hypothetical protein n=1 Tax=Rhizobium beringeri TaxID=3019934 RepID=UPI002E157A4F|nr:hypothetical protein U8Q06_34740 [Rhizobium beringeri]
MLLRNTLWRRTAAEIAANTGPTIVTLCAAAEFGLNAHDQLALAKYRRRMNHLNSMIVANSDSSPDSKNLCHELGYFGGFLRQNRRVASHDQYEIVEAICNAPRKFNLSVARAT